MFSKHFQFIILVAFFAFTAAYEIPKYESVKYEAPAPKYEAPAPKYVAPAPKYEASAPVYVAPKYVKPKYEEVKYVSLLCI